MKSQFVRKLVRVAGFSLVAMTAAGRGHGAEADEVTQLKRDIAATLKHTEALEKQAEALKKQTAAAEEETACTNELIGLVKSGRVVLKEPVQAGHVCGVLRDAKAGP